VIIFNVVIFYIHVGILFLLVQSTFPYLSIFNFINFSCNVPTFKSLTPRGKHRLKVFENKVLSNILDLRERKGRKILYNEELHNIYLSLMEIGFFFLNVCYFDWAPCHEGILGEWKYSSTHYWPQH
jgi:hypothetical protein